MVKVRRSGGFLGRTKEGGAELAPSAAHVAALRNLIAQRDVTPSKPKGADRYIYEFEVDGRKVVVHEGDMSPELRAVANELLES